MKQLLTILGIGLLFPPLAWSGDLQSELMAKEQMLWTAWGAKDAEAFRNNLTADSVQIGSAGIYNGLDAILTAMSSQKCDMRNFDAQDVEMRRLGRDVVVLNYTFTQEGVCNGDKLSPRLSATSIYVQKGESWLSAHYHESPIN